MAVLQTILIVVLVYYFVKMLAKWLMPKFLVYAMKKAKERFGIPFPEPGQSANKHHNNGDASFFGKQQQNPKSSKKVGEYIDFEEIE